MTNSPITTSPDRALGAERRALGALPWLIAAGLLFYAWWTGGSLVTVMSFALIYAVFVSGLNVFMGFAGQVSFGQNAFAAISGYVSAVLTTTYGFAPLAGFLFGMGGALACALLIGWPTLRLKGHYLAMATLAVGLIVYEVAVQWQSVTQGYMGISGIPPLGIGRFEVTSESGNMLLLVVITLVMMFIAHRIRNSRLGRAFVALAGSEDAARALGIDVARYKLISFLISAAYAALAGWLFVHVVGFVSPEVYGLHMVVLAFTMLYVGGIGTIVGPLVGAIIISLLPETFRAFKDYQDLAYGAVLILLLIYAPRGIASLSELTFRRKAKA
jgi:branched-chain amino acid transport system permease protein